MKLKKKIEIRFGKFLVISGPEIRLVTSDGKKQVSTYIAGIIPIGPGRRYTLSN